MDSREELGYNPSLEGMGSDEHHSFLDHHQDVPIDDFERHGFTKFGNVDDEDDFGQYSNDSDEQFYRNVHGTTFWEIIILTSIIEASQFALVPLFTAFPILASSRFIYLRIIVECAFLFLPFTLAVTILNQYAPYILLSLVGLWSIFVMIALLYDTTPAVSKSKYKDGKDGPFPIVLHKGRLTILTNTMSNLLLCVCTCILAVDIPFFPRKLAKTETYGWSLMDVGVGFFIGINAALSPEARLMATQKVKPKSGQLLVKSLVSSAPLLILGFIRLISVKLSGYREIVTEYGVHWNFFFTLAATKLFSTAISTFVPSKFNYLLASVIILPYQYLLSNCGLKEYLQNEDRSGLIAANKEGIFSLLGSMSLHFIYVRIGEQAHNSKWTTNEYYRWTVRLATWAAVSLGLMLFADRYIERVSRREFNLAYLLWMICLISCLLALECGFSAINRMVIASKILRDGPRYQSLVNEAIGFSGMVIFLLANLMTGGLNLIFDLRRISSTHGFLILFNYSLAYTMIAYICLKYNIRLKIDRKGTKAD